MEIPGHEILRFQFLKVELRNQNWRQFIQSDNPVAAALLAKMGYNEIERRQVRIAYMRMLLRLRNKLDDAKIALIMSVADLYYRPEKEEEEAILRELREQYPEEGETIMELMPAWTKWAKEEGLQEGLQEGLREGMEKGRKEGRREGRQEERQAIIRKLLDKGHSPEEIADTLELPVDDVRKLGKH